MIFSHSRLSCFEQCPLKFRYKYIDGIETEIRETIETFLGSRVHEALEKLYKDLKSQKLNSMEEILAFFNSQWDANWNESILIAKSCYSPEDYKGMGTKFLADYYNRHKPFDVSQTIDVEKQILVDLNGDKKYRLVGYIDRLSVSGDAVEIHDYKTSLRLPEKEQFEQDRQLALYAIAARKMYPFAREIKLVWHFLAFGREIRLVKTDMELEQVRRDTMKLIDKINSEKEFSARESALCRWCEFQQVCGK